MSTKMKEVGVFNLSLKNLFTKAKKIVSNLGGIVKKYIDKAVVFIHKKIDDLELWVYKKLDEKFADVPKEVIDIVGEIVE